jgi:hypothetical protein
VTGQGVTGQGARETRDKAQGARCRVRGAGCAGSQGRGRMDGICVGHK